MKTTKKDLEKQIAELTAKHELQELVESKLPMFKDIFTHIGFKGVNRISIDLTKEGIKLSKMSEAIHDIIAAFPPGKNNTLGFAGKADIKTVSPFKLRFVNNVYSCQRHNHHADIEYSSGNYEIDIHVPVTFYSNDCKGVYTRGVTDCEYHYFIGYSMNEIRKIQLHGYQCDIFTTTGYFGGDRVTYITDKKDKQDFEVFVLNGHIPEFVAFWKQQLIDQDNETAMKKA